MTPDLANLDRELDHLIWLEREYEHLVQATRHLADWKRRVADQEIAIEEMNAKGWDTSLAEVLLQTMRRTLVEGRRHQQLILEVLASRRSQGDGHTDAL
ncbi:hypothetical protein [Methylobacterium nigriterrae]|uniref:hypothetical protein n=1 Tax=Methylobacterium nigriterrae TaxID=3127512 RepID=UPI003013B9E8